jgi:hypothetical protein
MRASLACRDPQMPFYYLFPFGHLSRNALAAVFSVQSDRLRELRRLNSASDLE